MICLESALCGEACGKLKGDFIRTVGICDLKIVCKDDISKESVGSERKTAYCGLIKFIDYEVLCTDTADGYLTVCKASGSSLTICYLPSDRAVAEINIICVDYIVIGVVIACKSIADFNHCVIFCNIRSGINALIGVRYSDISACINYELYGIGNVCIIVNNVACLVPIDLGTVSLNYPAVGYDKILYVNGLRSNGNNEFIGFILAYNCTELVIEYGCDEVVSTAISNVCYVKSFGICLKYTVNTVLIPVDGNGGAVSSVIGITRGERIRISAVNGSIIRNARNGEAFANGIKLNVFLRHLVNKIAVCIYPSESAVIVSKELNVSTAGKEAANYVAFTVVIGYLIDILELNGEVKTDLEGIAVFKYLCYCESYCLLGVINNSIKDSGILGSVLIYCALNLIRKLILVNVERLINNRVYHTLGNGNVLVCVELVGIGVIEICDALVHIIVGHVSVNNLNKDINDLVILSLVLAQPIDDRIGIKVCKIIINVKLASVLLNEIESKKSVEVDRIKNTDYLCEGKLITDEYLCFLAGLIKSSEDLVLKIIGNLIGLSRKTNDLSELLGNNKSYNESVVGSDSYVNKRRKDAHCLLYVLAITLKAYVDVKLEGIKSELCLNYVVEEICKLLGSEVSDLTGHRKITDKLLCKIKVNTNVKTVESYELLVGIAVHYRKALEGKKQILYVA